MWNWPHLLVRCDRPKEDDRADKTVRQNDLTKHQRGELLAISDGSNALVIDAERDEYKDSLSTKDCSSLYWNWPEARPQQRISLPVL